MDTDIRATAQDLLDYIARSPTPFHAVEETRRRLEAAGFSELREEDSWNLEPHGRHFVIRNGSSVTAFVRGARPLEEAGCLVVGAHTDSPNLRLKPIPSLVRHGYRQLGVAVYGGALLASWADRDLGLAGRVFIEEDGGAVPRLLQIDRPIARVSQVAIHLDREVNDKGLSFNKETQLPPLVGLGEEGWEFREWVAAELGVKPERILDHDLMLHDVQPPALAGLEEEFLFASRLDNLASCHAAFSALLAEAGHSTEATRIIVLYDNEEVGSSTRQGASGPLLDDLVSRLNGGGGEGLARLRARSFLISADMAHALHPNYPDKHEAQHQPRLNGGPVIKYNASARYATDADTGSVFQRLCREAEVPCQKFAMRSDMPCGSTIGPLVSTRLGIRTVDVGNPMLAMHSIREMAGAHDPLFMVKVLRQFFRGQDG